MIISAFCIWQNRGGDELSYSKVYNIQELGKDIVPQSSLKLKKGHELVVVQRKRNLQKLADEQASTRLLPSETERPHPERAAFTNSTETQMKADHTDTDDLHHTDELVHIGELSEPKDVFNAYVGRPNEQDLTSDARLQTSEKLISKTNAQAKSPKQFMEDLENDPTYSKEFKKNIKIVQFFAQEA